MVLALAPLKEEQESEKEIAQMLLFSPKSAT
jgi:hypothetical protein